jgi:hypothetical protein
MNETSKKSRAKVLWTQQADGSWEGVENVSFYPRRWRLVRDPSVTHRTKVTLQVDPMDRPSRMDCPSFEAAKRYVARYLA